MQLSNSLLVLFSFYLFFQFSPSQSFTPPPGLCPSCFSLPTTSQSTDYGRIVESTPASIFAPRSPRDISLLLLTISNSSLYNNVTVGPNGARHSTEGQAQVPGGVVVEMRSFPRSIKVDVANRFVDADGGALWVEVLRETLKYGLSPRSWTDYLDLTVGGTLSVGGISGQTFKHGPEIVNVLEMDVITGMGQMVTCSRKANRDLFFGILGGLGQFGIITRARIALRIAPEMVKWVKILYNDFNAFTTNQQLLIAMAEPADYVEGQMVATSVTNITYFIELALYYNLGEPVQQKLERILSKLSSTKGAVIVSDVSYFDFLNRVGKEEEYLKSKGLWDVPHPWLNMFFPRSQIGKIKDLLIQTVAAKPIGGPLLIYPFFANKWDRRMSTVLPEGGTGENVIFVVSLLRSAAASCKPGSPCIQELLNLNKKIIDAAIGSQRGEAKLYLAQWKGEEEWSAHFGEKWMPFKQLKAKYDPLHLLAPGPHMFPRIPKEPII